MELYIQVATLPLLVTGRSYALAEPLVALLAAGMFLLLAFGWRRVQQQQPRRRRFWIVYVTLMAGSLIVALALGHDLIYPSQAFRAFALRIGVTLGVLALVLWLIAILGGSNPSLADYQRRGMTARGLPSLVALIACMLLTFAFLAFFPGSQLAVALALAGLGAQAVFGILILTTESFGQPRFLLPPYMRDQPGRLEDWLARRQQRAGRTTKRTPYRRSIPTSLTVVMERKKPEGWTAWSTDVDDFKADAATLDDLVEAVVRNIQAQYTHPGGGKRTLGVQFVAYGGKTAPAISRQTLFELSRVAEGGYAAQAAEDPTLGFSQHTLEELVRAVEASGHSEAAFSWGRDVEL
jgi:hypothetical protein